MLVKIHNTNCHSFPMKNNDKSVKVGWVNLSPANTNIGLAQNTKEVQQLTNFVIYLVVISCKLITVVKL